MKTHLLSPPGALILLLSTLLAVFIYNAWSYCCGYCSLQNFLTLGPLGLILAGANLCAFVFLLILRVRRRLTHHPLRCRCGTSLRDGWIFCPDCGRSEKPPVP